MKISKKMKMLFIIAVALGFAGNALAQNKKATNYEQGFRLGFGLSGGYVFDDPYDFALGADARIQYDLSKRYSITLTTGFTNMFVTGKKK